MKNVKIGFLLLAFVAFVFSSCNKNQRVVNDLEGTWTATSYKLNGSEMIYPGGAVLTFSFNDCKVKNDDCSGTVTADFGPGFGSDNSTFTYNIKSDGTIINMDFADTSAADFNNAVISNHTDTKITFGGVDTDGDTFEYTLRKD